MRIPILEVSQLRLSCFSTDRKKIRTDLKLICIDFILSINETGNIIRILERCKFRFHAILYLIPDITKSIFDFRGCGFQFWQCRDSSCHLFLRSLAVSRLHLIDPSSIEHNSACIKYICPTLYPLRHRGKSTSCISSSTPF